MAVSIQQGHGRAEMFAEKEDQTIPKELTAAIDGIVLVVIVLAREKAF